MIAALIAIAILAQHDHDRDQYKNPTDTDAFIARQEEPDRARWQKPDEVLDALALKRGQTVCDIGAGPGYFSLRASKRVGDSGRVFAVDVDPHILDALRTRIDKAGARNITPILALPSDPLLPPRSCDLILIIDVYHHFPDGPAYLRGLARLLRPKGRIVNIDWQKQKTDIGPPLDHRVAREAFLADAAKARLRVVAEPTFLPYQYFLIVAPRSTK